MGVGTRSEHFLQFISGVMVTLDAHGDEALWRKFYYRKGYRQGV